MSDPELADHLIRLGATEQQVAGLGDSELIGLAGDLALSSGQDMTLAELAGRTGAPEDRIRHMYRALGLDVDALPGFGDGDAQLVALVVSDESGMVEQVAEELLRVAGTALRRVAEATVAAYVQDIENHPDRAPVGLVELADLNMFASDLILSFADTFATMFRHHMWTAVRHQRSAQRNVSGPELVNGAVGFVDLVGYTRMSRSLPAGELMTLLDAFERRAFEVSHGHGGRIVKTIGDAVMFTGPDLDGVAMIAMALVDAFGDGPGTRPRAGVSAGEIMFRLGDLYGPIVNVASRLADVAAPGEVLTDVGDAAVAMISLRAAGTRELKGFDDPVRVWSISAGSPSPAGSS